MKDKIIQLIKTENPVNIRTAILTGFVGNQFITLDELSYELAYVIRNLVLEFMSDYCNKEIGLEYRFELDENLFIEVVIQSLTDEYLGIGGMEFKCKAVFIECHDFKLFCKVYKQIGTYPVRKLIHTKRKGRIEKINKQHIHKYLIRSCRACILEFVNNYNQ